uniref:Large envelope protein n=2 Tax=Parrot hepatitis B virus TaxID=1128118 RepID=M1G4W3_9HEPA|nr:large S protein [Parrot hepatitis B virus]
MWLLLKVFLTIGNASTLSHNSEIMGNTPAKSMAVNRADGGTLLLNKMTQNMGRPGPPSTWAGKYPTINQVMAHIDAMDEVNTLSNIKVFPEGAGGFLGLTNPYPPSQPEVRWTEEEDQRAREYFRKYQEDREKYFATQDKKEAAVTAPTPVTWKVTPADKPLLEAGSLIPQRSQPDLHKEIPIIKVPPKRKMNTTFGGILLGLIGLLVGFFLSIKILEILRKLDSWWISLSSPKERMLCAFQNTGAQTSPHYVGSCPWGCIGFLWTCLRLFIIFLLILLVGAGLLYLTENMSTILGKLQWGSVLALFSSISSLLPSDPKSLVALIFGLLLIWMTSSSVTQTLVTLTQLATLCALFFKNTGSA